MAGAAEELGHESGGALLGAAGLGAPSLTYLDHDVAELGYLEDRLDHVSLVAGEAAVLEGVEVAFGGPGTGPAATPGVLQPCRGGLGEAEDAAAFGERLWRGAEVDRFEVVAAAGHCLILAVSC